MASALADWSGEDTSVAGIERELGRLRGDSLAEQNGMNQRTSVMTLCSWAPAEWLDAAESTLAGLAQRHPSRTMILTPLPDEPGGLDAELSVRCFPDGDRHVCGEVIELRLRGNRSAAPASIVLPLLLPDLPVFCRWRGEPPFGHASWEQLIDVADRVIVDSSEWSEPRCAELAADFERTAVSDLSWARLHPWRVALARRWPAIAKQEIEIRGPLAEAALLRGWLASRLDRSIAEPETAELLSVSLDGEELQPADADPLSASDLLSAELDRLTRDRVYEAAVLGGAS